MGYDDRTIKHRNSMIRWIHTRRYHLVINLLKKYKPKSLLDYGAGTGSFLRELLNYNWKPEIVSAYEPMMTMYYDLESKFRDMNFSNKVRIYNNLLEIAVGYDAIIALGVLEHLTIRKRYELYEQVKRLLNPNGYFIVQVPIMIGFGVILRILAKFYLRKESPPLSVKELLFAGLFLKIIDDDGRFDEKDERIFLGHRGFDHRKLLQELECHFKLQKIFCGPVNLPYNLCHSFYSVFKLQ
jgi:SAM-dependent methyltransferase